MAKPSIFSKDYDKKMKRRRNIKITLIFLSILILVTLLCLYVFNDDLNNFVTGTAKGKTKTETEIKDDTKESNKSNSSKEDTTKKEDTKTKENTTVISEKTEAVKLNEIDTATIHYTIKDDTKTITKVVNQDNEILEFDVSPEKKGKLIYDPRKQNIFYIDSNNMSYNITKQEYVSTTGNIYKKDDILNVKPGYVWNASPKFLNETTIVYVSQLPWFERNMKYLWIYNINTKTHFMRDDIVSENLLVGNKVDGGIQIDKNGQIVILQEDLNVK